MTYRLAIASILTPFAIVAGLACSFAVEPANERARIRTASTGQGALASPTPYIALTEAFPDAYPKCEHWQGNTCISTVSRSTAAFDDGTCGVGCWQEPAFEHGDAANKSQSPGYDLDGIRVDCDRALCDEPYSLVDGSAYPESWDCSSPYVWCDDEGS